MRRRLLSERIEKHLDRGNELMDETRVAFQRTEKAFQRSEEAFQRNEEAFKRNEEAFKRNTEAFERMMAAFDRFEARWDEREARFNKRLDENEQAMWEMNRRAEKAIQVLIAQNEKFNAEQTRRTDAIVAEVKESREESRALREALLALIDRLPPAAAA
jgi:hypothetical protein